MRPEPVGRLLRVGSSGAIHDGIAPSAAGPGAGGGGSAAPPARTTARPQPHGGVLGLVAGFRCRWRLLRDCGSSRRRGGRLGRRPRATRDAAGDPTDAGDRDDARRRGDEAAGGGALRGNEANKPFAGFSTV